MPFPEFLAQFWQDITGWAVLAHLLLTVLTLCWVLHLKREPMSAIAWCLAVVMLPFGGPLLCARSGYQRRPPRLARRRGRKVPLGKMLDEPAREPRLRPEVPDRWRVMAKLAADGDGAPVTAGN